MRQIVSLLSRPRSIAPPGRNTPEAHLPEASARRTQALAVYRHSSLSVVLAEQFLRALVGSSRNRRSSASGFFVIAGADRNGKMWTGHMRHLISLFPASSFASSVSPFSAHRRHRSFPEVMTRLMASDPSIPLETHISVGYRGIHFRRQ